MSGANDVRFKPGEVNLLALPGLTDGLRVEFDEPLTPHAERLMETLGVEAVVRQRRHDGHTRKGAPTMAELSPSDFNTVLCKHPDCEDEAVDRAGPYANLCRQHKAAAYERRFGRPYEGPAEPRSPEPRPSAPDLDAATRNLTATLQAVRRHRPKLDRAKREAEARVAAYKDVKGEGGKILEQLDAAFAELRRAAESLLQRPGGLAD